MAHYYYERYRISEYWDESSANAIDSKTLRSDNVVSNPRSETDVMFDEYVHPSGPDEQITDYNVVVVETIHGYNNHSFGNYTRNNIDIGDNFYIQEYRKLIKAEYTHREGSSASSYKRYCDYIEELVLEAYTIYKHRKKGSYVDTIIADDGEYPEDGISGSYWYVRTNIAELEPAISSLDDITANEGESISFSVYTNDTDEDSVDCYVRSGMPPGASFSFSGTSGTFEWTPDYNDSGEYTITFEAEANGYYDTESIKITVNNVIRPATISVPNRSTNEDQTLSFDIDSYIDNPDNINLLYGVQDLPAGANFNTNTGYFSWRPDYTQSGTYDVTFTISGTNTNDSDTMTITVINVERDPFIYDINNITVNENENVNFVVEYGNPDGFDVDLSASGLPEGASFDNNTGEFDWTPTFFQSGSYDVTFELTYPDGSDSLTVTITITEVHRAPLRHSPEQNKDSNDRRPYFEFELLPNDEDDNKLYHVRLRISTTSTMTDVIVELDSREDASQWELWDDSIEEWTSFPSDGVSVESRVKARPESALQYGFLYWDCSTWEESFGYGENTSAWRLNILISTEDPYVLDIEGTNYSAFSLSCSETSNGEIGNINFSVDNQGGIAYQEINYFDTVILAINDDFGNQEQFRGIVKTKQPSGSSLDVVAVTGDGILSERKVKENYPAQDIGATLKQIVDTYCSPLSSANINTNTGIIAPIAADGKTPLKVFEEIRRQHGIFYFVDANWDVNSYLPDEIGDYIVQARRGD